MEKIKKEKKDEIMDKIHKVNSGEYEVSWDDKGMIKMLKKKSEIKKGRLARASGQRFELKVREEMEKMGWIVGKWMNTVEYEKEGGIGKITPAKRKYNPFSRVMAIGTGFPDFICFKKINEKNYDVIGIEVKKSGYLDQKEKGMCFWLLENKIFSRILIAKQSQKKGEIEYIDFFEKYKNKMQ